MRGILLIDKPQDFTSFDVVAKIRGMLKIRRIGHAGTLDPMATGVLPLFVGTATKAIDLLPDGRKEYVASFRLGISTDTQDVTGTVICKRPVEAGRPQVESALESFLGDHMQLPPMYSAVRVGGQRLYDLARKGVEVERAPRPVRFDEIELLNADEIAAEYTIRLLCSKGAYVRTLCHDLGELLGCGAALTSLRRTVAAGFHINDCIGLGEAQVLADTGSLAEKLLPAEAPFNALPRIHLDERQERLFKNGVNITVLPSGEQGTARYSVYGATGDFLALTDIDTATGAVISRKML